MKKIKKSTGLTLALLICAVAGASQEGGAATQAIRRRQ